jgi:hypothetical protein
VSRGEAPLCSNLWLDIPEEGVTAFCGRIFEVNVAASWVCVRANDAGPERCRLGDLGEFSLPRCRRVRCLQGLVALSDDRSVGRHVRLFHRHVGSRTKTTLDSGVGWDPGRLVSDNTRERESSRIGLGQVSGTDCGYVRYKKRKAGWGQRPAMSVTGRQKTVGIA